VKRLIPLALLLLASLPPLGATDPAPSIKPSAPIKNFRLPTFNKAGTRTTFIRADEARFVTASEIHVKDVQFTIFTKDGTGGFDTVLLAPRAIFKTDKQVVSGDEMFRLIRMDIEVTGEQWSYHHAEKRVFIGRNARVIYQEPLKDIIK
jgi:hypothetical protein